MQVDRGSPRTPCVTGCAGEWPGIPGNFLNRQHPRYEFIPGASGTPFISDNSGVTGSVVTGQGHIVSFSNWRGVLKHYGYLLGGI